MRRTGRSDAAMTFFQRHFNAAKSEIAALGYVEGKKKPGKRKE